MRIVKSHTDTIRGVVTYDLGDGRWATFPVEAVKLYGLAALLRYEGIEPPTERVPVIHHGRRVGTMAPDFDPLTVKSHSWLYDPRPDDFRHEGDTWVAARTLGPGDLDSIVGFSRESN